MRILDVGCGDGSVGVWVCEQVKQRGGIVEYVGVDFDDRLVSACAERLRNAGIDGYAQTGDAHRAPPGPFDAILCFELIEHVPDPGFLLDSLEQRLAPGGRIYISTPNGTFGAGSNPRHLRTYDLEGLLDVLRRRGTIREGVAGYDGVAVASYQPAPRLGDVAIYLGSGWERWAPWDIETRGLGGSETAAVRLGEQLAARGYVVTIYADTERALVGEDGLLFEHHNAFDPSRERQAVISSRNPLLFDCRVNTQRRILWLHDVDCGDLFTLPRAENIDAVMVLSEWHRNHTLARYPWLPVDKMRVTANGIHPTYFDDSVLDAWGDRAPRAVYSSSPDRGLDILLELWPRVRERVPDAELVASYAPVYQRVADVDQRIRAHRDMIRKLADQPGVTLLDGMSQPNLARLLGSARVWLHPSWATAVGGPFHETYCIGAVEAAAAGCQRVGSPWGALTERGLER